VPLIRRRKEADRGKEVNEKPSLTVLNVPNGKRGKDCQMWQGKTCPSSLLIDRVEAIEGIRRGLESMTFYLASIHQVA
jgi:hypothetical protein